ncbi:hypothetical protein LAZ67_10002241 [Cordylochernes scorpioides]|uniref:HTH psq-type domain-containing protein n=1 Tax=Cordylochernes scorpioides TaxID=51811 RepID=A0ABY6KYT0_9ARAC|nr:hypothetical protein LAZ67_10002241 [Cordylochernes scorpioides]
MPPATISEWTWPETPWHRLHLDLAARQCTMAGTWWLNPATNGSWTNYTQCFQRLEEASLEYNVSFVEVVRYLLTVPAIYQKFIDIVSLCNHCLDVVVLPVSFSSFIFITMDRKKFCKKSSAKKKMMSIELKREIIEKHEQGVRVVDLSRQYGRSTSMICSVLKRKESIKSVTPAKGLTIISKLRTSLHENMEKLLMVWVTEKQLLNGLQVKARKM